MDSQGYDCLEIVHLLIETIARTDNETLEFIMILEIHINFSFVE
jgi:hypothetical protein